MDNKFPILETFERGVRNENVKLENKGKMSPSDSLKSARILKSRPKMNFADPKVPKPRGVIFCPYVFLGLFLRGEKSFWPQRALTHFLERPKAVEEKILQKKVCFAAARQDVSGFLFNFPLIKFCSF